jgi:hypothetical protein
MSETWDVHGKLGEPMVVLLTALQVWGDRDDSKPQAEVRRAANTAMDAIDAMLRDLYLMRARLIGEIRVSDDATAARTDALLGPEAVIFSGCTRCRRGTRSVQCGRCGGPACANCGKCLDCDGPLEEAQDDD